MIYQPVDAARLDEILRKPYNPPKVNDEKDEEKFRKVYWRDHARVKSALDLLGKYDSYGDADFCMNEDWQLSRGISVQLTSEKMIRPELVSAVQYILKQLPEEYSVYIDHGLLDLDDFFLLIESDQVFVRCDNSALIRRLGFTQPQ